MTTHTNLGFRPRTCMSASTEARALHASLVEAARHAKPSKEVLDAVITAMGPLNRQGRKALMPALLVAAGALSHAADAEFFASRFAGASRYLDDYPVRCANDLHYNLDRGCDVSVDEWLWRSGMAVLYPDA